MQMQMFYLAIQELKYEVGANNFKFLNVKIIFEYSIDYQNSTE